MRMRGRYLAYVWLVGAVVVVATVALRACGVTPPARPAASDG